MEKVWRHIATYVINLCVGHVVLSSVNPVQSGRWRAGAYTKRNMLTKVDHIGHIGHKFAKYCHQKLAGSVIIIIIAMKYWLSFMARVG